MLFISDIEWKVLKMICIGISIPLMRHKNFPISLSEAGEVEVCKIYCNICIAQNRMKLNVFIMLYKSIFRIQDQTKNF